MESYRLDLSDFKEIDKLGIKIYARYAIKGEKFLSWAMTHPSKGITFTINYPTNLSLYVETFGLDESEKEVVESSGYYFVHYDSWVLPDNGLAYQFRKNEK